MKEYKWQQNAFMRFIRATYFALAVDCGCGKTFAGIKIALGKMIPTIVIAPGHRLCEQWKDEILKIAGPDEEVFVYDKPTETKQGAYYQEVFDQWLTT